MPLLSGSLSAEGNGTSVCFGSKADIIDELGGEGGIRTHGELAPTAVFKTAALNHSATSPQPGPLSPAAPSCASRAMNLAVGRGLNPLASVVIEDRWSAGVER